MTTPHGVLAIISKKIFEKDFPDAAPGAVLEIDRYNSSNKNLAPLGDGLPLFLVTVRPKEQLLLVAVLEQLSQQGDAWVAERQNGAPVADIGDLVGKLRFTTGKGIKAKPGALGMSLQTPRSLTEEDAGLLRAAVGETPRKSAVPAEGGIRERLLAGVLADPDSDEPRMVMADWLMEQGDLRGELISIQCRLTAGIAYLSTRNELRQRAQELLEQHQWEWAAPLEEGFDVECRFRRGFVESVRAPAGLLFPAGQELLQREPVRRLSVLDCSGDVVAQLGQGEWVARLCALKLEGEIGDVEVAQLAGNARLAGLTSLNLASCNVTPDGARAIAASPHLTKLEMLALTGNEIGDKGATLLAQSPNLSACTALYLSRTELGDQGLGALAASPHLTKLRRLGLDQVEVSASGLRTLAESPNLPALRRVELQGQWPDGETVNMLRNRFGRVDF